MKKIILFLIGIVFLTVPSSVFAYIEDTGDVNYYRGTLDIKEDNYVYFGNDEYPPDIPYGINIEVDDESISSQWVNIEVRIDHEIIIEERNIYKFYVLANGKIVDTFYPSLYKDSDGNITFRTYYLVKPSVPELIGTDVFFQVLGLENYFDKDYVVAWSNISDVYRFDPLPVRDEESISILEGILDKLRQILDKIATFQYSVEERLKNIENLIENFFVPSQQALDRFENARNNLINSTPIGELQEEMENVKDMFEDSKNSLEIAVDEETDEIVFGEKRDWFGIGKEMYLIDLTEFKEFIIMFRNFLSAVLWIEFLFCLLFYLLPKLKI